MKVLYDSEMLDIDKFNFNDDLRRDQGLDSLNMTEFHVVLVYDSV